MSKIDKITKFKRLAVHRTQLAIKYIRLIGNLSNTQQYNYTEKDLNKIFSTLRHELDICEARFKQEIKRPIKFTFTELENCPFCGGPLTVTKKLNPYGVCSTENCFLQRIKLGIPLDVPENIKAWNTRAKPDVNKELLEALKEVCDCFAAAYAEEMQQELGAMDVHDLGSLADLVSRRLLPAYDVAQQAIANAEANQIPDVGKMVEPKLSEFPHTYEIHTFDDENFVREGDYFRLLQIVAPELKQVSVEEIRKIITQCRLRHGCYDDDTAKEIHNLIYGDKE